MTKFSVLLPTRNGLAFLKHSVASVIRQNYSNWEIIISDNASSDDIENYVKSLNEPRIFYSRSEEFLSVTDNWNRCFEKSTGEYIIMLGNDDILLKNYFQILLKLIKAERADLIYVNAFVYAYPNVLPNFPKGLFHPFGSLNAMPNHKVPFLLDLRHRIELVRQLMRFEPVFGTNMQHALVHRSLIDKIKIKNQLFYSPYPDFYVMCALFLHASRMFVYPEQLVVIGITSESHGYYFFNKKEKEGLDYLNIQKEIDKIDNIQSVLLPVKGSMLSFWLGAVEMLQQHFSLKKYDLKVDYRLYRKLQIKHLIARFLNDIEKSKEELRDLMKHLSFKEKLNIVFSAGTPDSVRLFLKNGISVFKWCSQKIFKLLCDKFKRKEKESISSSSQYVMMLTNPKENKFVNSLEIFEQFETIDCTKDN